jgi:hypothetical protein
LTALRLLSLIVLLSASSSTAWATTTLYPAELVLVGGENNFTESTYRACDGVWGCFDGNGELCSSSPDSRCEVALVPKGRCTEGTGPCIWPQGAGHCTGDDPNTPWSPLVPCLPDNPGLRDLTVGSHLSALCPGSTLCDMTSNDPSCECQGDDPNAPDWEGIVCSLNPNETRRLYCSDGGKIGYQMVDQHPTGTIGGFGEAMCTNISFVGTEAGSSLSNCGYTSRGGGVIDTPVYGVENPDRVPIPQRKPGSGLALPLHPIRRIRTTVATQIDAVGAGDFSQFGIRRHSQLANSYFADPDSPDPSTGDTPLYFIFGMLLCDPPLGWQTQQPVRGFCWDDPNTPDDEADLACIADGQCPTYCDPATFEYCHETGTDSVGFLWTRDLTSTQLSVTGALGDCPPDCGTLLDLHTYEYESVVQVGLPEDAADPRASIQLALDNLEGPRAGRGDFVSVSQATRITWLTGGDPHCYVGGDPYVEVGCNPCADNHSLGCCAPVGLSTSTGDARCAQINDPNGDAQCAAKIGRCELDRRPCNPTIGGETECGWRNDCYFCGGAYDGVGGVIPGLNGGYLDCPECEDAVNGNGLALPVGYTTHGFDALDLVAHNRTSILNRVGTSVHEPLLLIWTNSAAASSFLDGSCDPDGGGNDRCQLGETFGGESGIGTGGSFSTSEVPNFDPGGVPYQYDVSWGPENTGTIVFSQQLYDVGPGLDGIQGCIGDNSPVGYREPCDQRLGNSLDPGSTGTDDEPVLADYSTAQDGSDWRPATIALWKVSDPFADTPVINMVTALSVRDHDVLGLTDNMDLSMKAMQTWCPIVGSAPDCTRKGFCADRGGDVDGDGICNDDDPDVDNDGVLNAADNCVLTANPVANYPAYRTTTGGQLDDDADGYGNHCDGDFGRDGSVIVTALDTVQYKTAVNRPVAAIDCGSPAGSRTCDQFDLDGSGPVITALDTIRYKQLLNRPLGPKCPACPLACVGDACP